MIRNLLVVTAVAAAGLAVGAAPASAGCYGTDQTVVVCVDPTGSTLWSDCVHLGTDPCTPVTVPGPVASCDVANWIEAWIPVGPGTLDLRDVDCYV